MLNLYAGCLFGLVYALGYVGGGWCCVQTHLPNTPVRAFASKCVSWCHSNLISALCLYGWLTCKYGAGCRESIVYVFRFSLTYFVMDTLNLVLLQRWRVIREKFLYHHIVAIMLLYIGASRNVLLYTPSILYYFWLVEASNVLLPIWDLARVNRLECFQALTRPFLWTYIPLRIVSFTHGSLVVYQNVMYLAVGPYNARVTALVLMMLVNAFSLGFSILIVKKYGMVRGSIRKSV